MLDKILDPISSETFFSKYFEKDYLVINREKPDFFKEILTYEHLDRMLFSMALFHPQNRVVDNASETFPDPKTYTMKGSNQIDPLKFSRYYAEGGTLVFAGAQERISSLRTLSNEVGTVLKHPFQTNIYLTPKNAQGFSPHYDTHDVFILQFEGEKTWQIYDSNVELPDKSMAFEKGVSPVGNVVDEFTLKQGDTLYIPRGIMHDAYCMDQDSGHITLGLIGKSWAEHIATRILEKAKDHSVLRKHPKLHERTAESEADKKDIMEIVSELMESLESDEEILNDFYAKEKSLAKGQLLQAMRLEEIELDSKIIAREKDRIRISKEGDQVQVMFYDIKVSFPDHCMSFINELLETENPVKIEDIQSGLDNESKLLLAKELAKQGIVEVADLQSGRELRTSMEEESKA